MQHAPTNEELWMLLNTEPSEGEYQDILEDIERIYNRQRAELQLDFIYSEECIRNKKCTIVLELKRQYSYLSRSQALEVAEHKIEDMILHEKRKMRGWMEKVDFDERRAIDAAREYMVYKTLCEE